MFRHLYQEKLLWLILGIALLLRLPLLSGSFWLDEAAQALESSRPFSQQLDIVPDFQPPLLHYITHFSLYFGDSEWWLRTTGALLPGLISIWATHQIGRKLGSARLGLVAALLLATSSFHIFYSQELRPYALPLMFATLSWLVILNKSRHYLLLFTGLSIAGIYSSYLYPFLLLSQLTHLLLIDQLQLRKIAVVAGSIGLSFLPWLPMFMQQLAAGSEVRIQLPGWSEVVSIPQLKSLPLVFLKFIFGVLDVEATGLFIAPLLGLSILVLIALYQSIRHFPRMKASPRSLQTLLIWMFIPLITAWIVSFWIPVVQPKRVIFLQPTFYLLIMWVMLNLRQKLIMQLTLAILLGVNLWSTTAYYLDKRLQREDWRALIHNLEAKYPAGDLVAVFSFPEPFAPWRWYANPDTATLSTGALHVSDVPDLNAALKTATEYENIVLFEYLQDLSDPERTVRQEIELYGYSTIEILDYPGIGFTRVYAKPDSNISAQFARMK
ncbi:MAG: glycosyltransferase family 39 protein [bacterium]|nr:glycosyltransferase family 39 protein [bacterium]